MDGALRDAWVTGRSVMGGVDGGSSAAHDGGLGEEAGLVAASVERAPLFVEEEALAQQAVDGRPVASPFRLGGPCWLNWLRSSRSCSSSSRTTCEMAIARSRSDSRR